MQKINGGSPRQGFSPRGGFSMPSRTKRVLKGGLQVRLGEGLSLGEPKGLLSDIKPPYLKNLALSCCLLHT